MTVRLPPPVPRRAVAATPVPPSAGDLPIGRFALHRWLCALIACGFAAAAFGLRGPLAALGVGAVALALSYGSLRATWRARADIGSLKKASDAVAAAALVVFGIALLQGQLLAGLLALLLGAQLALNLQWHTHRQALYGPLVAFVALLVGAGLSRSSAYLGWIAAFGLLASGYLASAHVDRMSVATHGATTAPTASPPAAAAPGVATALGMAALLGATALLIYLLLPRFPAGNLGASAVQGWNLYPDSRDFSQRLLPEQADLRNHFDSTPKPVDQGQSSISSENPTPSPDAPPGGRDGDGAATPDASSAQPNADPRQTPPLAAGLQMDPSIYLYVQSPRPLYLQHQTRTHFDGRSWHALQNAYRRVPGERGRFTLYPDEPTTQVDVAVARDLPVGPLAPDTTVALSFPADTLGRDHYDGLRSAQPLRKDTHYRLSLADTTHRGRVVDSRQALPDAHDLQLPPGLDPRIAPLAAQVAGSGADTWQRALALERHLRASGQYRYSLSTLARQNDVPLADFLFGSRSGHCEYFATALAVMLRTQGIPARMVSGFVATDFNPVTGFYEVKGTNGHAWVQAWADGRWVLLEATGAYTPPEPASGASTIANQQLQDYLQRLRTEQERLRELQPQHPPTLAERAVAFWQALTRAVQALWQWLQWAVPRLAIAAAGGAVLWWAGGALWRRHRRAIDDWRGALALRHRRPHPDPRTELAFGLHHVQALLARHGLERPPGQPLERYVSQLRHHGLLKDTRVRDGLRTAQDWVDQLHYRPNSASPPRIQRSTFIALYQGLRDALHSSTNARAK